MNSLNKQFSTWMEKQTPADVGFAAAKKEHPASPKQIKSLQRKYPAWMGTRGMEKPDKYAPKPFNPKIPKLPKQKNPEISKGLRGPQKGARYQKLGAKFSEEVEPTMERGLPKDVQWAVAAHKRHKTPETSRAVSEAFRRHEFREDPYAGIKGFKRQPFAFGKLEKHKTPKMHRHVKMHPELPGASFSERPPKRKTKNGGLFSRMKRYISEHEPTHVSSGHGRGRTALYGV